MVNRQNNNQNPKRNYNSNSSQTQNPAKVGGQPQPVGNTSQNARKRSDASANGMKRTYDLKRSRQQSAAQGKNSAVRNGAAGTQNKRKSRGTEILGRKSQKKKKSASLNNTQPDSRSSAPQNNSALLTRKTPDKSAGTSGTIKNASSRSADKKKVKAARKAMNAKYAEPSRKKFRGGNYVLYYLLFGLVAVIVFAVLSNTVLFNCNDIVVDGAKRYSADEIIDASKVRKGDNLLHIDKTAAEEKIVTELAYIDSAKVRTSFPTRVVITVEEAQGWFCVSQNGVNMLVSRGGKILEKGSYTDVPVVTGYNAKSLKTGGKLQSDTEAKQNIPQTILVTAEKIGLDKINSIDVSDRYSIIVEVDRRITLELGGIANIESKIIVAKKLIETEISPSENVTILLSNPEKVAVHTNVLQEPENSDVQPIPDDTSDTNSDNPSTSE